MVCCRVWSAGRWRFEAVHEYPSGTMWGHEHLHCTKRSAVQVCTNSSHAIRLFVWIRGWFFVRCAAAEAGQRGGRVK